MQLLDKQEVCTCIVEPYIYIYIQNTILFLMYAYNGLKLRSCKHISY